MQLPRSLQADKDDDVIRSGNDTSFGLASGIWTRDINKAHRTAHRLRAGTVLINCYSVFDAAMPFGGYKESGWGREVGHNALDNYLETKSVSPSSRSPTTRKAEEVVMQEAVIVSGVRTPVGAFAGDFKDVPATELGAHAVRAALQRAGISGD